jgi:transcription-repair coupling factor (superfamily II helicase)
VDQRAAIHAVIQDMISPKPMDRLVCGDVGFGKTEVALRAAFVAVHGGKQVAHPGAHHAAGRAALPDPGRPLRQVAGEDRRAVALPQRQGGEGGARRHRRGTVDIVVGTHKLLSPT